MRAAASRAANRLNDLFADEPVDRPILPLEVRPFRVARQVMHQADQLERQLRARLAIDLFGLDEVFEREFFAADMQRVIALEVRLRKDRQKLAAMPLHAGSAKDVQAVVSQRDDRQLVADAAEAEMSDGRRVAA